MVCNNGCPLQLVDRFQNKQEKLKTCKENTGGSKNHKQKWVTFTFFGNETHYVQNFSDVPLYVFRTKLKTPTHNI